MDILLGFVAGVAMAIVVGTITTFLTLKLMGEI